MYSLFPWNDLLKCICFLRHKYLSFFLSLSIIGDVRDMQSRTLQISSFWSWFGIPNVMLDLYLCIGVWPRIQHFTEWDFLNWMWIERDKARHWTRECRRVGVISQMCLWTHRWGRWWARIPAHTRDTCTRQKQTRSPYRECMSNSSWPLLYGSPAGERG